MSFVITDTSQIFSNPATVATATVTEVEPGVFSIQDGTSPSGVQVGGTGVTYVMPTAEGVQRIVLSGEGNRLNVESGEALISVIGGGQVVESLQQGNSPLTISLGEVDPGAAPVDQTQQVFGDTANEVVAISDAAGGIAPAGGFVYYAHGGVGSDQIAGSNANDFIRGGAGDDQIRAGGGSDLVRGGAGSDNIQLNSGAPGEIVSDTVYYTGDQLDGSTDTIVDFATGEDRIAIDSTQLASTAGISGLGSNTVVVSGAAGDVTIISQGTAINVNDINFV